MNFANDITEQYLNKTWDDFSKEQMRLLNDMKTDTGDDGKKMLAQQHTQINAILMAVVRLRNIKKKLSASL
tara:strand:- start:1029 stop:1241 length:213 start_codon:yes stop_codon:yes gene_type:complete